MLYFGLRNLKGVHSGNTFTAFMYLQHNFLSFIVGLMENHHQNHDDKIHSSIIIIHENDLIHGWLPDVNLVQYLFFQFIHKKPASKIISFAYILSPENITKSI
eukprot:TRINITY_DN22789_c0_g1_i3.p1 TRINITY_DN22789_c0_g1~~TRINITY_DN22789_c0_g1_i3.p1  ORF type:complete len:103 (-),score=4.07 TRINITY_DN22789_c0_g1_i3:116-424(-)